VSTMHAPTEEFRHEAFLYDDEDAFVRVCAAFVREGVEAEEPTLVVVDAAKIGRLREELGTDAERPTVRFADMAEVGVNPARIIPAWRDFVDRHAGEAGRLRGIGEPIWPERSGDELAECERHERLLNLAFDGGRPWWLLCPYDLRRLQPEVVDRALTSHPFVRRRDAMDASPGYLGASLPEMLTEPLPGPRTPWIGVDFDAASLAAIRHLVARCAARAGLRSGRIGDLLLAVNEVATNSVRHGGGQGRVRVWQEGATLLCEVADGGLVEDPLVGRHQPGADLAAPRGLWLANQLCELVQLRSSAAGTVVRLHMRRP
jgi:anti-sigma regulatory factor (Ser/Thr protein kinase)